MYKCVKNYRKVLDGNNILVFTEGANYTDNELVRLPQSIISEYFIEGSQSEPKSKDTNPLFNTLLDQIKDTHEKKNHDYGNSFAKSMDEFGMLAAAIRLSDKLNRFKSLIKSEAQVKDESIEDTLLDMAAYAIITIEYLKKKKL